ncbi:MAG TPA: hypothetical protein VGC90_01440 [Candidatus Limnocylindrales bacterium]|jgi:hypothetical protein
MDILQNVIGGGQGRQDMSDFVNRYKQGAPWEGISDKEVTDKYNQVATQLPAGEYRDSAEQAFAKLTPEQRAEFTKYLQTQAQQQSVNVPDLNQPGLAQQAQQDPGVLAGVTTQIHQQGPNILQQLLGNGGALSNPLAKAALAGITAMAAQKFLGGRS